MTEVKQPEQVRILDGVPLKCTICQHDRFHTRKGVVNSKVTTFFQVEWMNRAADCHVCDRCGFVHWFLRE